MQSKPKTALNLYCVFGSTVLAENVANPRLGDLPASRLHPYDVLCVSCVDHFRRTAAQKVGIHILKLAAYRIQILIDK